MRDELLPANFIGGCKELGRMLMENDIIYRYEDPELQLHERQLIIYFSTILGIDLLPSDFKIPTELRAKNVPDNIYGIMSYMKPSQVQYYNSVSLSSVMSDLNVLTKTNCELEDLESEYEANDFIKFIRENDQLLNQVDYVTSQCIVKSVYDILQKYMVNGRMNRTKALNRFSIDVELLINLIGASDTIKMHKLDKPFIFSTSGKSYYKVNQICIQNSYHVENERSFQRSIDQFKFISTFKHFSLLIRDTYYSYDTFFGNLKDGDCIAIINKLSKVTFILVADTEPQSLNRLKKYLKSSDLEDYKELPHILEPIENNKNLIFKVKTVIDKGEDVFLDDNIKKIFTV